MSNLTRWDPYREFVALNRAIERMFNDEVGDGLTNRYDAMPWDVSEDEEGYTVKAVLPGVKPDDIEITYNNNLLTVKAEMKADEETEKAHYHIRERRYGTYQRSVTLPATVKADDIQASFENGILTLHLPKAEEVKPRRIQVKGTQPTLEGTARSGSK